MDLNTLQEIERAIDALTPQQRDELLLWVEEQYPQPIDQQLRKDLKAGRLDNRISRALAEQQDGQTRSL